MVLGLVCDGDFEILPLPDLLVEHRVSASAKFEEYGNRNRVLLVLKKVLYGQKTKKILVTIKIFALYLSFRGFCS